MTITGGAKFFDRNLGLYKDGAGISATTNDALAKLMIDISRYTAWESSGSDDTTTETITWDLPTSRTIDRLLIVDHNLKQFTAQYWTGSAWADFSSVVGIDGALVGGISETAFADSTAYYEFAEVTTSRIQVTATKTQTADQEKQITTLIVTKELGTFSGYPIIAPTLNRPEVGKFALSGRLQSAKRGEIFTATITMTTHPTVADNVLAASLFDRDEAFLCWLCGGRRGSPYFQTTIKGFGLDDLYHVVTSGAHAATYVSNRYINPIDLPVSLVEALP